MGLLTKMSPHVKTYSVMSLPDNMHGNFCLQRTLLYQLNRNISVSS